MYFEKTSKVNCIEKHKNSFVRKNTTVIEHLFYIENMRIVFYL